MNDVARNQEIDHSIFGVGVGFTFLDTHSRSLISRQGRCLFQEDEGTDIHGAKGEHDQ